MLTGSASDSALAPAYDDFSLLHSSNDFDQTDGFDRAQMRRSQSLSDGSFRLDWQLPRAPVRFPLRDALMSPAEDHDLHGGASSQSSKGPLTVKMTKKAKDLKYLSHRKRYDLDPPGLNEVAPSPLPRPPPHVIAKKEPAKKALNSHGTEVRIQAMQSSQHAAQQQWAQLDIEPPPKPAKGPPPVKGTLTSSARAVLSLSRRFAQQEIAEEAAAHTGKKSPIPPNALAHWSPARQSKGLPRPVREWVCRGLEFTDGGLGIGDRFDTNLEQQARRAPGHIYNTDYGNIARYRSEASVPTKQPEGRHHSAETHKMGARRDLTGKRDRQRPGPGAYEVMGFAQELVYNLSKRPKGEAPRNLGVSPPSSPNASKQGGSTTLVPY